MKSLLLFLSFVLAVISLAEVYQFTNLAVHQFWVAAALINSVIALVFVCTHFKKFNLRTLWWLIPVGITFAFRPHDTKLIASITWIPIIEEFAFRGFFRDAFLKFYGKIWGSYASIVFFALAHSQMTLKNTLQLNFSLFLGTFLLGLACELLMLKFKKFWPVIALHAICNFTPILLLAVDPRWLNGLSWLYIKSGP